MTDYATIYWASGVLSESWLRSQPGIESVEVSGIPHPVQFKVKFLGRHLTFNVMPSEEVFPHITGFKHYVRQLDAETPSTKAGAIIERLSTVRTVVGCVIEPGFDEAGYVGGLLTSISLEKAGLIFAFDSVLDSDGEPVIGPLADSGI